MSEFLSRLGGAALNELKGTPLDRIVNELMGGQPGASGLQALVERLRAAGLGDRVESWIGRGENRPVQPQELDRAFQGPEVDRIAHEAGLERPGLLAVLSQVLPKLVDAMTPDGHLPQAGGEGSIHAVPGQPDVAGTALGTGAGGVMPRGGAAAAPLGEIGGGMARHPGQGAGGEAGLPRFGEAPASDDAPASGALGPKAAGPERER